jgi:RNase adaptor protein for sRNA GlmZ degradation
MLHIDLYSFGYHKSGIPENRFGNGGGFVFDCRFLPNPGREARFLRSTGLDRDVQEYLAALPETASFMGHALALIEQAAAHYTDRGFEHLQVSFGCTGGQHRSVFCAEYAARLLQGNGYSVQVTHVERERWL